MEIAAGRPVVQYRGRLMPLVTLPLGRPLEQTGLKPVLVFAEGDGAQGLVVDEIEDIVDEMVRSSMPMPRRASSEAPSSPARATDIVDVDHLLGRAPHETQTRRTAA